MKVKKIIMLMIKLNEKNYILFICIRYNSTLSLFAMYGLSFAGQGER